MINIKPDANANTVDATRVIHALRDRLRKLGLFHQHAAGAIKLRPLRKSLNQEVQSAMYWLPAGTRIQLVGREMIISRPGGLSPSAAWQWSSQILGLAYTLNLLAVEHTVLYTSAQELNGERVRLADAIRISLISTQER